MISGIVSKLGSRRPNSLASLSKASSAFSPCAALKYMSTSDAPTEDYNYIAEDFLDEDVTSNEGEWSMCSRKFMAPLKVPGRGEDVLNNPLWNKGTAFKTGERDRLRLRGLLPPRRLNMVNQKMRFLKSLREKDSDILKNQALEDLHDRNETLYHRILVDHIEEMAPLIYTPTVGQACKEFGMRYTRTRGMYFTEEDHGHMAAMVHNWPHNDVRVICVTDGSRILGLGDLGANGMGIPIGKLSLYCAAGGIPPHRVLPIVIDAGTDNEELLEDEFYLGVPEKRLKGRDYYKLIDEFMQAVKNRWPNVLVQFEDFSSDKAQTILNHYRNDHLCFNDDIQGTGATTLAGILSALRAKGESVDSLGDQKIAIAGAGSAGIGVGQVLVQAMVEQGHAPEDATNNIFIVDQNGLLGTEDTTLSPEQKTFARETDGGMSMDAVIEKYKPTILLGMTGVGGLFTEGIIKGMTKNCDRPIIFPLSNPTVKAECTAEQAFTWTDGNCIFASGSPFDPVTLEDGRIMYPTQCNNMYIFPGLGLGVTLCGAQTVSDQMLYVAAVALANHMTAEELAQGKVFPPLSKIRDVSRHVAVAVIEQAIKEGQARKLTDCADLHEAVYKKMYDPVYVPLVEKI